MRRLASTISRLVTKLNRPAPLWLVAFAFAASLATVGSAATYAIYYGNLFVPTTGSGGSITVANGATGASGDAVFGLTSTGANNPYIGVTGAAQPGVIHFYANGTGSSEVANLNSSGALFLKSLAASQCVRSNSGSTLATTGADCLAANVNNAFSTAQTVNGGAIPPCYTAAGANCGNTVHIVTGTASFSGSATSATVTLSGSAAYSSTASYTCFPQGAAVYQSITSATQFFFATDSGSAITTTVNFACIGT